VTRRWQYEINHAETFTVNIKSVFVLFILDMFISFACLVTSVPTAAKVYSESFYSDVLMILIIIAIIGDKLMPLCGIQQRHQ
jgi:hypothetical protein